MPFTTKPGALFAASALALTLALAACGAESNPASNTATETVSITDAQDRTVDVPVNPETVVATDWSVIRTLNGLGVEVDAVPIANSTLPADLEKYSTDAVTKIGTLQEPDYEKINELEPDLIIVGSRSGTPEVVAELTKITPNVVDMSARFDQADQQVAVTEERVVQLGQIFDKEGEAQQQMNDAKAGIAEASTKAADAGKAMVVQVSGGKASAYGPNSRFGIIYADYGFADTGAPINEEGSHGEEVTSEFFTKYNPDVIFVLDRAKTIGEDETAALEVLNNDLVNATEAAKNNKLVEIEGFSWYLASAAPASLEQMTTDVNQAF